MSVVKAGLLALLGTLSAAAATAQVNPAPGAGQVPQCQLYINVPAGSWIVDGFDPFAGTDPGASFDVLFVNTGDRECRFFPLFQLDQAPFGIQADSGPRVPYTLYDDLSNYDATPLGGRTLRRAVAQPVIIAPHGQQAGRYTFHTQASSLPGDGLFTQRLILEAEDVNGTPIIDRQIVLGVRVLPSAVMTLAGAFTRVNGQADVDLGTLQTGIAPVPLQLQVRSTRAYQLSAESMNGGRLRLGTTGWYVPYDLIVNGQQKPASGGRVYESARNTGNHQEVLPLGFRIGSVEQHRAGIYSDLLTLTVAVQ